MPNNKLLKTSVSLDLNNYKNEIAQHHNSISKFNVFNFQ